jgi:hypothetical protein
MLYDPDTRRCSDGIVGGRASSNCGAESAIEAEFVELARRRLQGVAEHDRQYTVTSTAAPKQTLRRRTAMGGGQDRCNRRID